MNTVAIRLLAVFLVLAPALAWGQGQLIPGNRTLAGTLNAGDASGSGNAYTLTLTPPLPGYVPQLQLAFRANFTNTGPATVNVNALGARALKKWLAGVLVDVEPGDIMATQEVLVLYDGGVMQLVGGSAPQVLRPQLGTIMPGSYLTQHCLPSVPTSSTTLTAFDCTGVVYAGGASVPVTQAGAPVGPLTGGDGTYWIALTSGTGTPVSGWTRQGGTHYLWRQASTTPLPVDGIVLLAKVTIAASVITAVEDVRTPASLVRRGTYDVDDPLYGGVADDTTDIGPALRAAIAAAGAVEGAPVRLPAGRYALASNVTIPAGRGVTIQGDGWTAPAAQNYDTAVQPFRGTWIHIRSTGFVPFTLTGTGSALKGIAFDHDQPVSTAGWVPTDYPYVIEVVTPTTCCTPQTNVADVVLEQLFFYKATRGIHQASLNGWAGARIDIRGLWGQFFTSGIFYEFAADVCRVTDVHMWPYWSIAAPVMLYTEQHLEGMRFWRVDAPDLHNVFIFGAGIGLNFPSNAIGNSSLVLGTNVGVDRGVIGFASTQPGLTARFVNFFHNAGGITSNQGSSTGIFLNADAQEVFMSNVEVANTGSSCAAVGGTGTVLSLNTLRCTQWALNVSGAAGLGTSGNGAIAVSGATHFLPSGTSGPPYVGTFFLNDNPSGAYFDRNRTFLATMVGNRPTLQFAPNTVLELIPEFNALAITATGGTYTTGGVKKYLCIQDGVLTVGTTCP